MLNLFYRALNSEKGFTLIEVLVVVAIIGILAALAAPLVLGRIEDARVGNDEALARQLTSAVEQWFIDEEIENGQVDITTLQTTDLVDYLDAASYAALLSTTAGEEGATSASRGQIMVEASVQGEADTIIYVYVPEED